MASSNMTVLVEMPNLSSAVRIFHKLDDVNSLLNLICSTCPFFEISRMTAFRNSKQLERNDKLSFGEHLVVKYKYENLDRADTKAELEKVLEKLKEIDGSIQLLSTLNEDLMDKEQQNPNKVVYVTSTSGVTELSEDDVLGKSDVVYYADDMPVPIIRVKFPGTNKAAIVAPGRDKESQERFRRIARANDQRIHLDVSRGEPAVLPMEYMTKKDVEMEKQNLGNFEAEVYFSSEESDISGTTNSFIPDDDIPQLRI
ncbi:hypothetical protein TWF718_005023 [Orbilia javanica]|uniref:Uncharacterized protein n=1 Tax=Orbilia javanica TaxID=47235 RepID=A0AAN8RLJ8_9PEZI